MMSLDIPDLLAPAKLRLLEFLVPPSTMSIKKLVFNPPKSSLFFLFLN